MTTWYVKIWKTPATSPTPTPRTINPTFRAQLYFSWDYHSFWVLVIQPTPHRLPVALFWDLFRGLHLTSWRWMACRRINYPHDLLGVSETLQPDYPRIPPDHYFKNHRGTSLSRIWSPQSFEGLWVNQCSVQLCSVMGYQHLAKLCRLMGCLATLLKPHWILT